MGVKIPCDPDVGVYYYFYNCLFQFPVTTLCFALKQVFPALGHLQLSRGICECVKEREGKKLLHTYMLQRSAMNKKHLKPFWFAMTMTNEILLM